MASLKNQIVEALKTSNAIGQSKRSRKKELGITGFGNGTDKIHSIKYFQSVRETSIQFAKFVKEKYNVKNISQLTVEHKKAFLDHLANKGDSTGYLSLVESHLIHLERAVNYFNSSVRGSSEVIHLVPERTIKNSDKQKPQNRSFGSIERAKQVISKMSTTTQEPAILSLGLGFRIREAVAVRVEHVKEINGRLYIDISAQQAKGVTKGGRPRQFQVPAHFENELRQMLVGKSQDVTISGYKGTIRAIEKSLQTACLNLGEEQTGNHRFRHTFARYRLTQLLDTIPGGHLIMKKIIENKSTGRRMNMNISISEKAAYNQVKKAIDVVHSELGHNGKRWELVLVYMS